MIVNYRFKCCFVFQLTGRFCYLPMPAEKLREFLHFMNELCREAEDEITFNIYLVTQFPGVAVDYFYDGPPCDAERTLLPFLRRLTETFGPPMENSSTSDGSWQEQTTSYQKYQQRFGAESEKTHKMWKSAFLGILTPEVKHSTCPEDMYMLLDTWEIRRFLKFFRTRCRKSNGDLRFEYPVN